MTKKIFAMQNHFPALNNSQIVIFPKINKESYFLGGPVNVEKLNPYNVFNQLLLTFYMVFLCVLSSITEYKVLFMLPIIMYSKV